MNSVLQGVCQLPDRVNVVDIAGEYGNSVMGWDWLRVGQ